MRWRRGFADAFQDFGRSGKIGKSLADVAPALVAIGVNEEGSVERNVMTLHTRAAMQQAVSADYTSTGIAQHGELTIQDGLPDEQRMLFVINTYGNYADVLVSEFFAVPRELAQLAGAIRSPISSVEDQKQALAAHRGEMKFAALLILEREIGSQFACSRRDLGPGQDLPNCRKREREGQQDNPETGCFPH